MVHRAPLEVAKAYEEFAIRELRAAGFRITMPRIQVIRALADTQKALSAYAIHEKIVNAGGKIDVVSVYRILSTLQEVSLIHYVGIAEGYFPCRIVNSHRRRSEVIVCEETGTVTELNVPGHVVEALEAQTRAAGFELVGIKIELTGCDTQAPTSDREKAVSASRSR